MSPNGRDAPDGHVSLQGGQAAPQGNELIKQIRNSKPHLRCFSSGRREPGEPSAGAVGPSSALSGPPGLAISSAVNKANHPP